MRHFAHHIGDYAAATAHLSMLEDAAYHRLLRLYYQNEGPLTTDENELMRRVRAVSRHEKTAVRSVLQEFFTLSSDGWHQSRADKEINTYKGLANRGRTNGVHGGRPKANQEETATTNQEPLTKNHKPIEKKPAQARKTKLPDDWQPSEELLAYAAEQGCPDPKDTAERFRLHHLSKGTLGSDWTRGFQYWCRNEKNFSRPQSKPYPNGNSVPTQVDGFSEWSARLRGYREGGLWMPNWGPRPEDGGRDIPPQVLAAWRAAA
jgi:uncharacterized protein YdaU (DUF1376 family)